MNVHPSIQINADLIALSKLLDGKRELRFFGFTIFQIGIGFFVSIKRK